MQLHIIRIGFRGSIHNMPSSSTAAIYNNMYAFRLVHSKLFELDKRQFLYRHMYERNVDNLLVIFCSNLACEYSFNRLLLLTMVGRMSPPKLFNWCVALNSPLPLRPRWYHTRHWSFIEGCPKTGGRTLTTAKLWTSSKLGQSEEQYKGLVRCVRCSVLDELKSIINPKYWRICKFLFMSLLRLYFCRWNIL